MTTITRIRTDYVQRLHVFVDDDATVIDAFVVDLPPYMGPMCVPQREGMSIDETWRDALRTLAWLRSQPYTPIFPLEVFVPFGIVIARSFADVQREQAIKTAMLEPTLFHTHERHRAWVERYRPEGAHDRRVAELCRAMDLQNGAPLHGPLGTLPLARH